MQLFLVHALTSAMNSLQAYLGEVPVLSHQGSVVGFAARLSGEWLSNNMKKTPLASYSSPLAENICAKAGEVEIDGIPLFPGKRVR